MKAADNKTMDKEGCCKDDRIFTGYGCPVNFFRKSLLPRIFQILFGKNKCIAIVCTF